MNHSSAALLSTTASEAIVSIDGRVKRRIPNYETIILNISDKNKELLPNACDAVNDEFADIPLLLDPVNIDKHQNAPSKRHGAYVLVAIVIVTFAWSLYSIFQSPSDSFIQSVDKKLQKFIDPNSPINDAKQFRRITDLILHDNEWNTSRINSLLTHWQALDINDQQLMSNQSWFQHFTYQIQQQFKQEHKRDSSQQNWSNKKPFTDLGIALGVLDSKGKLLVDTSTNPKFQELIAEIKQDIAQVETAAKKDRENSNSERELNNLLKQQLYVPIQQKIVEIKDQDIQLLLTGYKGAYEKGDLKQILTLFGVDNLNANATSTLTANFESVFKNTAKRSINFHDYTWESSNNHITINSQYNGLLEFKNKKGTQSITARAKIKAAQKNNQLYITSIKLLDSKVNVEQTKLAISDKQNTYHEKNIPQLPNASELQDLTTQLVTAYETGDIEQFTSLFSESAKTNDRNDLQGIKKDYVELFSTTSDRQMFIQDLRWLDQSNVVKGTGELEVTVLSNNGNTVSMHGKIQIVAQKINNKVHITRMYHIEREN